MMIVKSGHFSLGQVRPAAAHLHPPVSAPQGHHVPHPEHTLTLVGLGDLKGGGGSTLLRSWALET